MGVEEFDVGRCLLRPERPRPDGEKGAAGRRVQVRPLEMLLTVNAELEQRGVSLLCRCGSQEAALQSGWVIRGMETLRAVALWMGRQ